MKSVFVKESFFSVPRRDLFSFHERKDAFLLLTPPSEHIDVFSTASTLAPSPDIVRFANRFLFLKFNFQMKHTEYQPPEMFVDEQLHGLFNSWRHEHLFKEAGWEGDPASLLTDRIKFSHPLLFAFRPFVVHKLSSLFRYRHQVTAREVHRHAAADRAPNADRVVVTGATGLIGSRLTEILCEKGLRVVAFVRDVGRARKKLGPDVEYVHWDFTRPEIGAWRDQLKNAQAIVHLAGTPLFKKRWTGAFKEELRESRIQGTRQLIEAIKSFDVKPEAFITSSALGIYGTDPSRVVDESSDYANDFLARICIDWETEARRLEEDGVRTVQIRTGIVQSTAGGALKELLPLFRMGIGGPLGHADHYINWIHLEDIARIYAMAILDKELSGPVNAVAPQPVTMAELAQTVGLVLNRPVLVSYPPKLVRAMIGEAGEYTSGGPRVLGEKIEQHGYHFFYDDLRSALSNLLTRN